jgi:EAL domain-containing protein (putative c-di-GMP-specific phosphodiesterase class I)
MNFLFSRDCDEVQGYFFTKPLPAGDVEHFISRQLLPTSA